MGKSPSDILLEMARMFDQATPEELQVIRDSIKDVPIWTPLPGPQTEAYNSKADVLFYGGAAGGAKMLDINTPMPTHSGWSLMGDIKAGDIVFSEVGLPIKVLQSHPVKQDPESYRIAFDDGTEIDACADHQWLTYDAKELGALTRLTSEWREARRRRRIPRGTGKRPDLAKRNSENRNSIKETPSGSIKTTREIFNTLRSGKRLNHSIPVSKALQLPSARLPIDPYLLGVWLGDGSTYGAKITSADSEIIKAFTDAGYEAKQYDKYTYGINGGFLVSLRLSGLLKNKHIPPVYLRASIDQRMEVLKGLMDTDGTANKAGSVSFTSTRNELADGVHELIMSLGWKARIIEGRAKLNGKDCGPVWSIKWTPSEYVFKLERKKDRQILATRRTTKFRYISRCDKIPSTPMRCLTVDNPTGLYLVGRSMVPTHNSDLLLGLALTAHRRSIVFRREATQLIGLEDRLLDEILKSRNGWNGQQSILRLPGRQIEMGSCKDPGNEQKYQGRAHDGKFFDELTHFTEAQFRFLSGWNRSTVPGQRCRVVGAGNPPIDADGRWVIDFWAPWLNDKHANPAIPGELRWFTTIDGKDTEVPNGTPFKHNGQLITPLSRTFIPSSLFDNPFLLRTGYLSQIQALPEPLRSQMLGDFKAGMTDSEWQVIPTAWVDSAMARWTEDGGRGKEMDSLGVDVARGGSDQTVISPRHGPWFARLLTFPGKETPDGATTAGLVVSVMRDGAPVHIDVVGWGSDAYGHLFSNEIQVIGINGAESKIIENERDKKTGQLKFRNYRAFLYWRMREALDPKHGDNLALPPDPELRADLCAAQWKLTTGGILIRDKDEIKEALGRSPDKGDAAVMALISTPKTKKRSKKNWRGEDLGSWISH